MSHLIYKSAYKNLEERLNRFPQGAPPSETLYKILSFLFTEKEAALVSLLPIKPFTIKKRVFCDGSVINMRLNKVSSILFQSSLFSFNRFLFSSRL